MADDAPIYDLRKLIEELKFKPAPSHSSEIEASDRQDDSVDFWCEDDVTDDAFDQSSVLNREWNRRHEEFHTFIRFLDDCWAGYREGITAGKEASAQAGFNVGFKQSVHPGYNWGLVRGITSAFANLPDHLKEKLAGKVENKDRLHSLHDSVRSISTTDALRMYHDDIKHIEARQNGSEKNSQTEDSHCSQLDSLYNELISLLHNSQEINVAMSPAKRR